MIVDPTRIRYGFLGFEALGRSDYKKQQGSFTTDVQPVSPCASLDALCMPLGVELRGRVNLIWNFLLDCLTEGKNIIYALLIVVPCEIKERYRVAKV